MSRHKWMPQFLYWFLYRKAYHFIFGPFYYLEDTGDMTCQDCLFFGWDRKKGIRTGYHACSNKKSLGWGRYKSDVSSAVYCSVFVNKADVIANLNDKLLVRPQEDHETK